MKKYTPCPFTLSLFIGKVCSHCKIWFSLEDFYRHTREKDGRDYICKSCSKIGKKAEYQRNKQSYQEKNRIRYAENREAFQERNRASYQANKQKYRARQKEYYQANKDKIRATNQEWEKRNREKINARFREKRKQDAARFQKTTRKYRQTNPNYPLRRLIGVRKYRAIKRGVQGSHTPQEWQTLCAKYGNRCLCCRQVKPLAADHVIPISQGGSNDIANIQPLCRECNSAKGAKYIDFRNS